MDRRSEERQTEKRHSDRSRWSMVIAVCVVVAMVLIPLATGGCDSGAVKTVITGASSGSETWTGNGSGNIEGCETGLHWILTPAGPGSLQSATLYVDFGSGYVSYAGYQPGGQGNGAFHFDSAAGSVTAAYADYTYDGDIQTENVVLTISHCNDGTTTTVLGATTTSIVISATTTTEQGATTTAVGDVTSTTAGRVTSTAVGDVTSTTAVGDLTTAGRIDTGGGGTAGPNVMLWLVVALLGALAVALGGSAIRSGLKQKSGQ